MRWIAALVLLVPAASAATEVHVTYDGSAYVVGFESDSPAPDVRLGTERVEPRNSNGTSWLARLPAADLNYSVEGRAFDLRAPPALAETTRIAFVADLGTGSTAAAIVAAIVAADPDIVLVGGDLAYAHADPAVWSAWFAMMEPLASRVALMPAWGNHEDVCATGNRTYKPCPPERNQWPARFDLPGDALYYAFDWGPTRITVLDTEAWAKEEGKHESGRVEQLDFLRTSLDGDRDRWDVVMFHRPLRTTSTREGAQNEEGRAALEPILNASADLVLAAHLHAYERSIVAEDTAVYVTSGGGGQPLYDEWGPEEPWLAKRAAAHEFVLLDISTTRIEGRTVRPNGSTLDEFLIERPAPPSPKPPPSTPHWTTMTSGTTPTKPTTSGTPTSGTPPLPQEVSAIPFPTMLVILALLVAWRHHARGRVRP